MSTENPDAGGVEGLNLPAEMPKTLSDISGLPDYAQGLYEKAQDGAYAFRGLGPMRSSLENARRERDAAKAELKGFDWLKETGKTPEEIQELIAAQAEKREGAGGKPDSDEVERVRKSMQTAADKRIAAVETERDAAAAELEKARNELQSYMIRTEVAMNLAADKLNGDAELIMPHVLPFLEIRDGALVVVDDKKEQRFNGKGQPMTPYDLLAEMRDSERFGRLFNAPGNGGGGASTKSASSGGKTINRKSFEGLPPAEQAAKMRDGYKLTD